MAALSLRWWRSGEGCFPPGRPVSLGTGNSFLHRRRTWLRHLDPEQRDRRRELGRTL